MVRYLLNRIYVQKSSFVTHVMHSRSKPSSYENTGKLSVVTNSFKVCEDFSSVEPWKHQSCEELGEK